MLRIFKFWILFLAMHLSVSAQEQYKLMFYNLLDFPNTGPASRLQDLDVILDDYMPDLFMVCELNSPNGADDILDVLRNSGVNYQRAAFVWNTSDDTIGNSNQLQNMIYYNADRMALIGQNTITTLFRDFNHYQMQSLDANSQTLDFFVCHLKASSGDTNEAYRKSMVDDFVAYLGTLPAGSKVVLAGDFNFYTSAESGFQELIDPTNPIVLKDPVNRIGSWHTNTAFLDVFTQSTRTDNSLGGAGGGFDDRFDFIMLSENLISGNGMQYLPNTYKAYGNNNNLSCFNQALNTNACAGAEFDANIREALYFMSDHLPVTLTLESAAPLAAQTYNLNELVQFVGGNIAGNSLRLRLEPDLANYADTLIVMNLLGQELEVLQIDNQQELILRMDHFVPGICYIATNNPNLRPLKFIKAP